MDRGVSLGVHGRKPRLAHLTWLLGLVLVFLLGNGGRDFAAGLQTPPPQTKPAPAGAQTTPPAKAGDGRQGGTRQGPPPPWWTDVAIQKEIGLTPQQVKDIQKLFDATWPTLRKEWDQLRILQAELDGLIATGTADETAVKLKFRIVETYRSQTSEDRFMMNWRISRLLTAEQNRKLKAIQERHGRDGRGGVLLRETHKHD